MRRSGRAVAFASLSAALIGGLLFAAKQSDPKATPTDSSIAQKLLKLRVALVGLGEINTLDPAKANTVAPLTVIWQVHERLVGVDESGAAKPMLAQSWRSSSDLREWRFACAIKLHFIALIPRRVAQLPQAT